MKMQCSKCGKRFDAEKHMYICPKCNHYHSQVGARSQMTIKEESEDPFKERKSHNPLEGSIKDKLKDKLSDVNVREIIDDLAADDDVNDAPEFIRTLNGEQTVYTQRKKPEKKGNDAFLDASTILKKIGFALCIIIGFIMFISNAIGGFDQGSEDEWGSSSDRIVTEVDYGTPMNFETFTVNVGEVSESKYDYTEPEKNYKHVQINFNTDSPYEYEDESIWTDVQVTYDTAAIYGNTYALYEDELASSGREQDVLIDDGLVSEAHYSGSYFWIFEVPEDAETITLSVESYSWDEDIQEEKYVMEIELDD